MASGGDGADAANKAAAEQGRLELEAAKTENDMNLKQAEFEHRRQMDYMKLGEQRRAHDDDLALRATQAQAERQDKAAEMRYQAAAAAQKPQTRQPTKGIDR